MTEWAIQGADAEDEGFLRLPIASTASYAADTHIADDTSAPKIRLVLHGVVRLSVLARDGRERVFAYLPRGSIFGEQRALADAPGATSAAMAFADCDCVIGFIEPVELIARIQTEPDLLRVLLRITHLKKKHLVDELERAVFHTARSQLASLLLALARDPADPNAIDISQERLARLSGRTRVTVAAQLHALASAGAIRLERSRIVLIDPYLLGTIAEEVAPSEREG
jgi:CRP/FNR family transcriptional regulator